MANYSHLGGIHRPSRGQVSLQTSGRVGQRARDNIVWHAPAQELNGIMRINYIGVDDDERMAAINFVICLKSTSSSLV